MIAINSVRDSWYSNDKSMNLMNIVLRIHDSEKVFLTFEQVFIKLEKVVDFKHNKNFLYILLQ